MLKNNCCKSIFLIGLCFLITCAVSTRLQKIELTRDNIKFEFKIENSKIYTKNDTIEIKYSVTNNSGSDIAIVDTKIKNKEPADPISFNGYLMAVQLDLGGLIRIGEFEFVNKYRILKNNKKYSTSFNAEVIYFINDIDKNKYEQIKNITKDEYIEISVETYISYSLEKEIIDGKYSEILNFEDYWGHLDNGDTFEMLQYFQVITLAGIYVKIDASDK